MKINNFVTYFKNWVLKYINKHCRFFLIFQTWNITSCISNQIKWK